MWIALWLVCPVIAAACARGRGRDATNWFLICLLTGIFGLAALFLMDPVTPAVASPIAGGEALANLGAPGLPDRACPYCAETIKGAAKICRFCNRDVAPVDGEGPIPVYRAKSMADAPRAGGGAS